MHHHKNHMWCSSSHWDGDVYDCRNAVDIDTLRGKDNEDWDKLIHMVDTVDEEALQWNREAIERNPDIFADETEEELLQRSSRSCPHLNQEVLDWLEETIKPQPDGTPGWCMGDDQYRLRTNYAFTLFFYRHYDAKKFIKRWSSYGKATSYVNYFEDKYMVLDEETGKLRNRRDDE